LTSTYNTFILFVCLFVVFLFVVFLHFGIELLLHNQS